MLFFFIELDLVCHRLNLHELVIFALLRHQLVGRAEFRDSALVDNDYLIRLLQGGESVRYHERCSAFDEVVYRILNEFFRFGIDGACRFVEDKHTRIIEYCTGNGYSLAFAAGETYAALAENGIVCIGAG